VTDETARLVVAVDSTSATKATDVLDAMTNSAGNAEDTVAALSKAFGPVAAEIARLTAAIDRQVSSYDSLATVNRAVATANAQATKTTDDQAKATEALGETSEQARDRIREMVQASLEQARADAAAIESTQKRSDAAKSVVTDLNAQVAASRRAQEAAEEYRAKSAASAAAAKQGAAGTDAQRDALDKLLKQIDPTIAALERLDKLEDQLGKAKSGGLIGGDDFERFASTIQQRRKDIADAGESVHGLGLNAAAAKQELGTLIAQLARGDISGFASSLGTAANNTGLLAAALTPVGAVVGMAALAVGSLATASVAGALDQQALTKAIVSTGDAAGVTADQVNGMVAAIGASSGQYGRAREALTRLIASGKVTGDSLQQAGQLAVDMAEVTGKSIQEAVASIASLRDDPVRSVKALDDQYHVLSATQYAYIKQLQEQGDTEKAAAVAQDAEATAFSARAKKVQDDLGYLERAWTSLGRVASATWESMKGIGRGPTTEDQLKTIDQKIEVLKTGTVNPTTGNWEVPDDAQKKITDLLAQKTAISAGADWDKWVAANDADNRRIQDEGKKATDTLDDYGRRAKDDEAKAKDIAKVKAATQAALAARPQDRAAIEAQQTAALKYIDTQYTDKAGQSAAKAIDSAEIAAEAQKFKDALGVITSSYTNAQRELDTQHKAGALSDTAYYQLSIDNLNKEEAAQEAAIKAEIARLQQRKVTGAEAIKNTQQISTLQDQAAKVAADASSKARVLSEEEAAAKDKAARAINAYVDALGRQETAARADADLQVQRLSMGDREFANMQRIISIRRQGADEQVRLASQLSNKQIDQSAYDAQAQAQQASTDRLVQIEEDGQKRIDAARSDWTTGSRRAMAELNDQATDTAGSFYSFVTSTSGNLSDFLTTAATKGTASIKSFVSTVLTEATRLASNRAVSSLLSYGLSFLTPGTSGASSGSSGFSLTGGTYAGSGSTAITWGGARAGGGSVNPSSAYRVAEQGPEVYKDAGGQSYLLTGDQGGTISPVRAGDGQATGSGTGGVQVAVSITIASDGTSSAEVNAADAGALGQQLGEQMQAVAEQVLARSMQPGGKLWRLRG